MEEHVILTLTSVTFDLSVRHTHPPQGNKRTPTAEADIQTADRKR